MPEQEVKVWYLYAASHNRNSSGVLGGRPEDTSAQDAQLPYPAAHFLARSR
jgi:hypothetical protein